MEKYQNKYRIKSARLEGYNYANAGMYSITICTANREHYFGEIIEGKMHLSEIGKIAQSEWFKTLEIRPDMNLQLDAFVVMPNHIHGIIIIGENEFNDDCDDEYKNKFAPQSKNLASIIRGYKSSVTKQARILGVDFNWQSRFYEHIIRSDREYKRISEYNINNPAKWVEDKFNG